MANKISFSFLTVSKTKESTEGGFKRYIGVASSFVLAVNPPKKQLDELMGFESQNEPEYIGTDDNGKFARINFIVKTDPAANNGVAITNRLAFTLRNTPAYNKDHTKVQIIDRYGNNTWANVEDAKAGKVILDDHGQPKKIDSKYRMARQGEADLLTFLRIYLNVEDAFNYINGTWILKEDPADAVFTLDHVDDYFNGDFSELREALTLQPNNKVKLLYGVRTTDEGKQYQVVASRGEFILWNSAGSKAYAKLEERLANAKNAGSYANTEFRVQALKEQAVEATDFSIPAPAADFDPTAAEDPLAAPTASTESPIGDMPWD